MKEDFSVPDFCSFSDQEDGESLPDINAWFGPGGTVSPLHYDPKNNLLCQVKLPIFFDHNYSKILKSNYFKFPRFGLVIL